MLIYCLGRLYYSPVAVWLIFGSILAGPAVAWLISQALLHADGLTALAAWSAIDHVLATTLLSGVLWNPVSYSLSPVLGDENRPELRALRAASAHVPSCQSHLSRRASFRTSSEPLEAAASHRRSSNGMPRLSRAHVARTTDET